MRSALNYVRSLSAATCFGLAMLVMIWAGAAYKSIDDHTRARHEAERLQQNFALLFEENVLRSIGEIDKALLYLRRMIETRVETQSLHEIVSTTDILSEIIVQVAVIDAKGIMRATNVGPQPAKPIDLSDREHYRAHLNSVEDEIFISKPVIGRASGKWSVQLTRRFLMPNGQFGGVVVGSLNPEHFTQFYNKLNLGVTATISLIGSDGIVRSSGGSGTGGLALGQDVRSTPVGQYLAKDGTSTFEDTTGAEPQVITVKKVRGYPLAVSVSLSADEVYAEAQHAGFRLAFAAVLLSCLVLLAMRQMSKAEERRQLAESHVRRLASEDSLTGLANRRVFQERAMARAAAPGAAPWAIAYVDVDRFKTINDTLGHILGDRLLQEVAKRLTQLIGEKGEIARLGGDEFAVLFPAASDPEEIRALSNVLVDEASKPFRIDGQVINCTISVGVARWPMDALTADELIVCADLALYASKEGGRNRATFFDPAMNDKVSRRREIELELRTALLDDKLEAHFQPIYAIDGKTVVAFEALARWHHPEKGWIPPGIFIGVAEECGLMPAVGEHILKHACRAAVNWPDTVKLAVNLSAAQFGAVDVPALVGSALSESKLDARRLEVEITESLLLDNTGPVREALQRLKSLGVGIAMDDFGTGYSSLSYLQKFPLSKIKIDRSFVRTIATDPSARSIVEAIINIAHSLGMVATAEGVETQEQFEALAALGCDQIQGFLLGKPMAPEQAGEIAARGEPAFAMAAE